MKVLFTPFRDPRGYDIRPHPENVEEYVPPYDETDYYLIGKTKGHHFSHRSVEVPSNLHRQIAGSGMTYADVLRFVERYGFLSMPELIPHDARPAEPYVTWLFARDELAAFCRGLDVLDSASALSIDPMDSGLLYQARGRAKDVLGHVYPSIDLYFRIGDLDGPEALLVNLRATAEAVLLANTRVGLDFDSTSIGVRPIGLYGAAWLCAIEELFGRKVARLQCLGCLEWFVPEHPNQKYHPAPRRDACRKMKYRRDKAAKDLAAGNES